jgi:uncharacterized membrane protein
MTTRLSHGVPRRGPAVLFATSLPLFLGTWLSDWAYSNTFNIQWSNFASWLNAGALVIVGLALAWSLVSALLPASSGRRPWIFVAVVVGVFVLGFINALVHAKDAWATMPAGLILSVLVFLLACAAVWLGFSARNREVAR